MCGKRWMAQRRKSDPTKVLLAICDDKPIDVVRIRNYNTQNKPIEMKIEAQKIEQEAKLEQQKIEAEKQLPLEEQQIIEALSKFSDLLTYEKDSTGTFFIVNASQQLGSENFQKINALVSQLKGKYSDKGFKIPIRQIQTVVAQ